MKIKKYLILIFIIISCTTVRAQDITGNIEGHIVDSANVPLPEVNISLQSENLQGTRGSSTDDNGYFQVLALPIGAYQVKISFVGYQSIIFEDVQVALGKTTNLGFIHLKYQTVSLKEIIVSGNKAIIDLSSTTYGGNLKSKYFEALPIDRDYQNMISLLPQANTSYFGDAINIGGATGFENKYFVDGVEVTDPLYGNTGTKLPYNFIKEVEVKAGGYESEFRSSLGGLINVVTYSGTNEFHGSIFGFYTNNSFGTKRYIGTLDPDQGDFSDYDFGFSLGGPIIKNKLWFFSAYNPTFNQRDAKIPNFGFSPDRRVTHSFAAKLTWNASKQLRLIASVNGDPSVRKAVGYNLQAPFVFTSLNPDPYLQNVYQEGINIALNGTYSLNQNILLTGSISRITRFESGNPSTAIGRNEPITWQISGIASGGTGYIWNDYRYSNLVKLGTIILLGTNTLNSGIEYKSEGVDNQEIHDLIIEYNSSFYQERIKIGGKIYQRIPSFYLQDVWRISKNLSVQGGLRWDAQFFVGSNEENRQKVVAPLQPRIGFTFSPGVDASQKIFGSYSRYAQELSLFSPVWNISDGGATYRIIYHQDPRISRTGADTVLGGSDILLYPREDKIKAQYYDEFSLGYEITFGKNFFISVQGIYRTLKEAIDSVYNIGEGIRVNLLSPKRNYTAMAITLEHQSENLNFLVSYVLSRNYGNYGGLFNAITRSNKPNQTDLPQNSNDIENLVTGLLPNDRTHVFKFSGSYRFVFGLITGVSFDIESGTPLSLLIRDNITDSFDFLSQRGTAGRTPATWNLSARFIYELAAVKTWHPKLILDIFNIASQRKPVDIHQIYIINPGGQPDPAYGQVHKYQPPMSARLGMEVNF